uniref:U8-buthitoxin-Hj3a n=1 Tax=Hottentotta judaicus TaxID=6863 RepID=F1CJ83_HOTJU|nr:U8-buthitoxin-Hj3a [Hottentotta judaicus]
MKILSVLLLAFIICSIVYWSEAEITDESCEFSIHCLLVCRKKFEYLQVKCVSGKCHCYPD